MCGGDVKVWVHDKQLADFLQVLVSHGRWNLFKVTFCCSLR